MASISAVSSGGGGCVGGSGTVDTLAGHAHLARETVRARVALTMGCPSGIGPEVAVAAAAWLVARGTLDAALLDQLRTAAIGNDTYRRGWSAVTADDHELVASVLGDMCGVSEELPRLD